MDGDVAEQTGPTCDRVRRALSQSPIFALRRLEVERQGDALILTGRVHTFYEKQLAQELVRDVEPEIDLVNSVAVD